MFAADIADCPCGPAIGFLMIAAASGAGLFDLIENFLVFKRGSVDTLGTLRANQWPAGEPVRRVVAAAVFRAFVAAMSVGFLAWVAGAITTLAGAGAVGFGLWPALTTFLGYAASHAPTEHEG